MRTKLNKQQLCFQKTWQRKYCKLYKASKYGIERLEIFESEEDALKTSLMPIITLENCIKITEDTEKHNQPHVFLVRFLSLHFVIEIKLVLLIIKQEKKGSSASMFYLQKHILGSCKQKELGKCLLDTFAPAV